MKDLLVVVRSVLLLRRAADQRLPVLITQSQRILCFRLSLFRSVRDGFADLWQEDLDPYRVMKRELSIVLINHASYPAVTRDPLPASLSIGFAFSLLPAKS